MPNSSLHIKMEYSDAVSSKRDFLMIEENVLKAAAHIKAYELLKKKEAQIKSKLKKDLAEAKSIIFSLERELPKEEAELAGKKGPMAAVKKEFAKEKSVGKEGKRKKSEIEIQLQEIQAKLAQLS